MKPITFNTPKDLMAFNKAVSDLRACYGAIGKEISLEKAIEKVWSMVVAK